MRSPESKAELLRQQVTSKIHWGASQEEVTDWLGEQHGVFDAEADQLLADAYRVRRRAVRERALIRFVLSSIGIALVIGFVYVRFLFGYITVGVRSLIATILAINLGWYSLSIFFRSAFRLFTGEAPGSVD